MSIKEKVQQIIQRAEAEKAAELRLQEEEQRKLLIEYQEKTRQQEALEKVRFEKGKKALEATGVQRVLVDVLGVLKEVDPAVELHIRKGIVDCYDLKNKEGGMYHAETVGFFVEKDRGEGETTTKLGVELEIDNPNKIWVEAASVIVNSKSDLFLVKDPALLEKIENRLAEQIAQGRHRCFNPVYEPRDHGM
ncbi:hypothetical protein HYU89_01415 [Candidatus Collierbacteria bacterium]|nr:hypothetical protein [Candidatus Collierbacteria bacterium]